MLRHDALASAVVKSEFLSPHYPVAIFLSFNLSRILVFCIVGNRRIGLNRYSGNAVAIYNLWFHDYPVNYCTSVSLGTIAC
jgi:hypothetical protein